LWLALSASVLWGLSYVIEQYLLRILTYKEILFVQSLITLLCLSILFLVDKESPAKIINKISTLRHWIAMLASGVVFTAATILILKSTKAGNASLAATIEASYPVFTLAFAYLILGEVQLKLLSLIGCLVVIIGLVIIKIGNP
jgi:drug/metabolite transporter (DMT)-like permease